MTHREPHVPSVEQRVGQAIVWSCDVDAIEGVALTPGRQTTCMGKLPLTQVHIDDGQVRNLFFVCWKVNIGT